MYKLKYQPVCILLLSHVITVQYVYFVGVSVHTFCPLGPSVPLIPGAPSLPRGPSLPFLPSLPGSPFCPFSPSIPSVPLLPTAPRGPSGPRGPLLPVEEQNNASSLVYQVTDSRTKILHGILYGINEVLKYFL